MRTDRKVTVADLKDAPKDAFLLCPECGGRCSAAHSDYSWWLASTAVMQCAGGGTHRLTNMRLVREVRTIEVLK